ncbi:exo-alpha-sialidase [Echinicola sediminis]
MDFMGKWMICWGLFLFLGNGALMARQLAQENQKITESLIFPLQREHVHSSSLVELPNGDWLTVWFQGTGERHADDVRLMGARRPKGSGDWSLPFPMADTPGIPDCNPVLFLNAKGKLFLVWIAVQANQWEQSVLRVRTSGDYLGEGAPVWQWQDNILMKPGKEFPEEVSKRFAELPKNTAGWAAYAHKYDAQIIEASSDPSKRSWGWMTRIQPLVYDDGRIILPLYSDGFNMSLMALSSDHGQSWKPSLPLVGRGPIQPALAQRKNGDLVALLRDSGDAPERVQMSISKDGGQSWSAAMKTSLPNTASVEMLRWDEEHWFFLGNDINDGRYQLSLYLSKDEGESWERLTKLENDVSQEGRFSYPCLVKGKDGLMHITYSYHLSSGEKSIKYLVLDPQAFLR